MNEFERPPSITVVRAIQKAEREKVLDELIKILKDRIKDNEERQENAWNTGSLDASKTYLLTCGEVLSSVVDTVAELRQEKVEK